LVIIREGKAPKFPEKPSIKLVNGKVVMSVIVEAAPEPTVTWYKGTTEVTTSGNILISINKGKTADTYLLIMEIAVSTQHNRFNGFCFYSLFVRDWVYLFVLFLTLFHFRVLPGTDLVFVLSVYLLVHPD